MQLFSMHFGVGETSMLVGHEDFPTDIGKYLADKDHYALSVGVLHLALK